MKVSQDIGVARTLFQQEQARNDQAAKARAEEALARDKGEVKPPAQEVRTGTNTSEKSRDAKSFSREAPKGRAEQQQRAQARPGSNLNILV